MHGPSEDSSLIMRSQSVSNESTLNNDFHWEYGVWKGVRQRSLAWSTIGDQQGAESRSGTDPTWPGQVGSARPA
jgi:hypothetical protein